MLLTSCQRAQLKTRENGELILTFLFSIHKGDPGKPGEMGPSGEPGIPVCI